jgi:hypothetical protein
MLKNYEFFDGFITQIFSMFEHQNFCKRTRLHSNMIYLLFIDLLQVYKVFFIVVSEVLDRFPQMNADQAQKCFVMYQNFVNLTSIMQNKGDMIINEFRFQVRLPAYYRPNPEDVEQLRIIVNQKKSNPSGLEKASAQLSKGMNRN